MGLDAELSQVMVEVLRLKSAVVASGHVAEDGMFTGKTFERMRGNLVDELPATAELTREVVSCRRDESRIRGRALHPWEIQDHELERRRRERHAHLVWFDPADRRLESLVDVPQHLIDGHGSPSRRTVSAKAIEAREQRRLDRSVVKERHQISPTGSCGVAASDGCCAP
jgi:hypothetical protein